MADLQMLADLLVHLVEEESAKVSGGGLWRRPILATAKVDERFLKLREMAAPDHLMPWELLPSSKTVIVFFLPFALQLVRENRHGQQPARSWGTAYVHTNALIARISREMSFVLEKEGYASAVTPPTHNFDPVGLMSRWSHKHLGYLAGLGRFGQNSQLITPSGCAGRLGSLVTEAALGDNPLGQGWEACLHKAGKRCLKCLERCPVGALSLDGFDRNRCWERLKANKERAPSLAGLPENTHVCGKCVAMLPCSFHDPVSKAGV